MFSSLASSYLKVHGLLWFDKINEGLGDWPIKVIHSSNYGSAVPVWPTSSGACADCEQVLLLEARLLGGPAVPLVAEAVECVVGRCWTRLRARRWSGHTAP